MAFQQAVSAVQIIWDDGIVIVFNFVDAAGNPQTSGFYHIHAEDWIETVKFSARNKVPITISYDNALGTNYNNASNPGAPGFSFLLLVDLHG